MTPPHEIESATKHRPGSRREADTTTDSERLDGKFLMSSTISDAEQQQQQHRGITKRDVAPLIARRRQNLDRDTHVTDHTHDADGEKIHRIEFGDKKEGTTETIEANLSKLLGATPSTTSNLEVLRLEAEQVADAAPEQIQTMNPHIPANDAILETAIAAIESEGRTPAWEVCDG